MEFFLLFAVALLAVFGLVLRSRLKDLQRRLNELERQVATAGAQPVRADSPHPYGPAAPPAVSTPAAAPAIAASPPQPQATPQSPKPPVAQRPPAPPKPKSETWKKIERQLVENWTGIVGAVILTAGLGFLGLIAALALPAFFRFLMLAGVAGGLAALSYYLQKKPAWQKFSSWIRSVAGAVALFACFGSAAVPGLRWIDDQAAGLALIAAGVAVNLFFAWRASAQVFASLHLLLSLVTLAILPQELPVFILSAIVSLAGVIFAYRSRWEHQALLVTASFAAYQIYRYFMAGGGAASFSTVERGVGIGSTALVGATALLMHYRRVYASDRFGRDQYMPFASHLVHWFSSVLGFLLYSTGSKWNTFVLMAAAVVCFLLARRGRSLGIQWLYRTDTVVAQSVALFAVLTLGRWDADPMTIAAVLFIETLAFAAVVTVEGDPLLEIIGRIAHITVGVGVFNTAFFRLDYSDVPGLYRIALTLGVLVLAGLIFERTLKSRSVAAGSFSDVQRFLRGGETFSLTEILSGLLLMAFYASLIREVWAPCVIAGVQIVLLYDRQKRQKRQDQVGAGRMISSYGLVGFLVASHLMGWFHLFAGEGQAYRGGMTLLAVVPFLASGFFLSVYPAIDLPFALRRAPGIALFSAQLLLSIMRIAQPVTPLLAGTLWLAVSMMGLELSLWMARRQHADSVIGDVGEWRAAGRLVLVASFAFVLAFVVRHILVELQTERYIGVLPVRSLIQAFAVGVFLYWFHATPPENERSAFFWRIPQPLFLEAALLLVIVGLELEFTQKWMTLLFAASPFVLLGIERLRSTTLPDMTRLRFYALLLYWVATFHLAFLSVVSDMPATHWLDRGWVMGGTGLLLLIGLVAWIHRGLRLDECRYPAALQLLGGASVLLQKRRNLWIFDPLFLAAALFLYWSFDRAILTLLWVGLVFLVFSLSVLLREGHFRLVALIALAACLGRLLFFDLSQSSLVMRAVVFVGVGVLMLGMNSLYNRFKDRFV